MNRGRKIASMVTKNEVNTQMPINKDANTCKLENLINTGNGIEFDTNRLNGIYIDDYDMVIDITTTQYNTIK